MRLGSFEDSQAWSSWGSWGFRNPLSKCYPCPVIRRIADILGLVNGKPNNLRLKDVSKRIILKVKGLRFRSPYAESVPWMLSPMLRSLVYNVFFSDDPRPWQTLLSQPRMNGILVSGGCYVVTQLYNCESSNPVLAITHVYRRSSSWKDDPRRWLRVMGFTND